MLTSHELFGFMSPAMANDIITFTFENEKPTYRATLNAAWRGKLFARMRNRRRPRFALTGVGGVFAIDNPLEDVS